MYVNTASQIALLLLTCDTNNYNILKQYQNDKKHIFLNKQNTDTFLMETTKNATKTTSGDNPHRLLKQNPREHR